MLKIYHYKKPWLDYPMGDVETGDRVCGQFSGRLITIIEVFTDGYSYISDDDLPVDC